jgi:beta-lactamase superfamily II metal-dependent hydrolase
MSQVEMIFYDVQHGNATYIRTPNSKHVMIDLGIGDYSGHDQNFSPLRELWHKYGVRQLDHVTITHPHLDHIDDILNFDAFSPKVLMTPRHLTDAEILSGTRAGDRPKFDKYLEIRRRYTSDVSVANDYNVPASFGGVQFQHFSSPLLPHTNFNNHSIVTVISYSGTKIVLPGDNERASFDQLMLGSAFRAAVSNADILLAPHHGRESAYHAEFVKLVNPLLTIVSDGSLCDTSSNHRYSANSRGWTVFNRSGGSYQRKCLTTNSDGEVYVKFGPSNDPNFRNFLNVQIA